MSGESSGRRLSIYDLHEPAMLQRIILTLAIAVSVAIVWWLLFGGGIEAVGALFRHPRHPGNPIRRLTLALALTIYFLRLLLTQFVFLKRAIGWSEAAIIAIWVMSMYLFLALTGGANSRRPGPVLALGVLMFLLGSWMNSWAEYQRHRWKQQAENRGRLYTAGLFRLCRHPNYLGDLISFSGMALIAGLWITGIVPALMLLGFVFANIPMLDAHLAEHYGDDFASYARHTRKLIPFVY